MQCASHQRRASCITCPSVLCPVLQSIFSPPLFTAVTIFLATHINYHVRKPKYCELIYIYLLGPLTEQLTEHLLIDIIFESLCVIFHVLNKPDQILHAGCCSLLEIDLDRILSKCAFSHVGVEWESMEKNHENHPV